MEKPSKNMSTKTMEKEGLTVGGPRKPPMSKAELLKKSRDALRNNLTNVYKENANAPKLPEPAKKKAANDILKKNAAATAGAKKPGSAVGPRKPINDLGAINVTVKNSGMDYTIGADKMGMFSDKIGKPGDMDTTRVPGQKRKTAREQLLDDAIEYHKKPNPRKLKELRDKAGSGINIE